MDVFFDFFSYNQHWSRLSRIEPTNDGGEDSVTRYAPMCHTTAPAV